MKSLSSTFRSGLFVFPFCLRLGLSSDLRVLSCSQAVCSRASRRLTLWPFRTFPLGTYPLLCHSHVAAMPREQAIRALFERRIPLANTALHFFLRKIREGGRRYACQDGPVSGQNQILLLSRILVHVLCLEFFLGTLGASPLSA